MSHVLELHEFFVEGGDRKRSHVLLHISEPSNTQEAEKGYFFTVAEVTNGTIEQITHLQDTIDILEKKYYSPSDTTKDPFECAIESINRRSHHVLEHPGSQISCFVGVLSGSTLSFAAHGSPSVRLLYQGKEDMEEMNLYSSDPEQKISEEHQLFPSLSQGTLNDGDYLVITSPHVEEYISPDRTKKIITSRSTRQAATHLETILTDLDNGLSFGGVILHILKKHEIPKTGMVPKRLSPTVRAGDTSATRREQQSEISPTDETTDAIQTGQEETNYRPRSHKRSSMLGEDLLVILGRALVAGTLGIAHGIQKAAIVLWRMIIGAILLISNKGGQRETVLHALHESLQEQKQRIAHLSLPSKILFVVTCMLAILFFSSIGYLRYKEHSQQLILDYTNKVDEISNTIDAASASLVYQDTAKAMTLLQQGKSLTTLLPTDTKEREVKKQELVTAIEEKLLTLRRVIRVTPTIVADLQNLNTDPHADGLWRVDDTLLAFGNTDPLLYRVSLSNKQTETHPLQSIQHIQKTSTPKENDGTVLLTSDHILAWYDAKNKTVAKQDITLANGQAALADIFVYNQRLYTLDVGNNQIYRHTKTQTGFDKASPWLKQTTINITKGVSLAIDGDVFVLASDGAIFKFSSGIAQPFVISGLDPALTEPTMIWTYNDIKYLYILEPINKRIILLTKDGKLVSQYTADVWQKPTGMVVDEEKKTIYVLDSNKIYSFPYAP